MMKRSVVMASLVLASVSAADPKSDHPKGVPQVIELAKTMSGTWACDGSLFAPNGKAIKIAGHMKMALDVNNAWLHESFDASVDEGAAAMSYKFEAFITFDAPMKKWRRIEVDSFGIQTLSSADPTKDGKLEWANESTGPDGKPQQQRTHFDGSNPSQLHVLGEATLDKGKSWIKTADLVCKK